MTLRLLAPSDEIVTEWEADVGFISSWEPPWGLLLGQRGFFDHFTVTFNRFAQGFALESVETFDERFWAGLTRRHPIQVGPATLGPAADCAGDHTAGMTGAADGWTDSAHPAMRTIIDSIIRIIDRIVIAAPIDNPESIEAIAFIAIPAW